MIECLECHELFLSLIGHVKRKHNMSISEYREKFTYFGPVENLSDAQKECYAQRKNKPLTLEHRAKISASLFKNPPRKGSHLTQEQKLNLSKKIKGIFKHTEEAKNKISLRRGEKHHYFGKKFSKEHREKLSISHSNNSYVNKSFVKGTYYSEKMKKTYHFRSSWEKIVMEYLDRHPGVTAWEYECFSIPYQDVYGFKRRYTPDFYVVIESVLREIWEVKPKFQLESLNEFISANNILKLNDLEVYAEKNDYEVRLITEDEINIIKNINWEEIEAIYA